MKSAIFLLGTIGIIILSSVGWRLLQINQLANTRDLNETKATSVPVQEFDEGVTLTPKAKDLGTVIYGEIATTTFTLTNSTANPLAIIRVSTSCGCTKAEAEKEIVDPNEETKIKVSFDPAVHQDNTDLGDVTRTIFIETDHRDFSLLEAQITAKVVKK